MKKTFALLTAVILTAAFLGGCQPTPNKPPVLGKDLEQMLTLATSQQETTGNLTERLSIPERYEASAQNEKGNFRVTIDADIILPDADCIPIVRVEAQPFSQETVNKLIAVLFDEGKLYDPYTLAELTKSEISEMLVQLEKEKAELEGLDAVSQAIDTLEQRMQDAPSEKELVEVTGALQSRDLSQGLPKDEREQYEGKLFQFVNMGQRNPTGGMRSIYISNHELYNAYSVEYINRNDFSTSYGQYAPEDIWRETADPADRERLQALSDPAMTLEQMQNIADQFLEQIGIDYLSCERKEKVVGYYGMGSRTGSLFDAYRLQYVRMMSGVPVTYTYIEGTSGRGDGVIWSWAYEKMTLIVNNSGIIGMKWEAPYRILETVTQSAAMLPFSQIQDVFEKMIIISNFYYSENGADMNITEVRLGLMRINEQDSLATGLLIPVWDFFGTLTTYYTDENGQQSNTLKETGLVWLTINAIDGTVIDRSLGY